MDFKKHIEFINSNNSFMIHNGIRLTRVEPDRAEAEAEVGRNGLNYLGSIHGGLHFAMADCAAGAAARSDGQKYVTLNATFDYIRGAGEGKIRAIAEVRHRGKNICRIYVRVLDGKDRLLADGNFTMYCLHEPFLAE